MADAQTALATLLASGKSIDDIQRDLRREKVHQTRDHFTRLLMKDDDDKTPAFDFTVSNWRAFREFWKEPPTTQHNPGGPVFEDMKHEMNAALKAKDSERFILAVLMVAKAVRNVESD